MSLFISTGTLFNITATSLPNTTALLSSGSPFPNCRFEHYSYGFISTHLLLKITSSIQSHAPVLFFLVSCLQIANEISMLIHYFNCHSITYKIGTSSLWHRYQIVNDVFHSKSGRVQTHYFTVLVATPRYWIVMTLLFINCMNSYIPISENHDHLQTHCYDRLRER